VEFYYLLKFPLKYEWNGIEEGRGKGDGLAVRRDGLDGGNGE